MFLNSLSGRFLMLTVVFVMLAEIMIFLPSVARYREDYLLDRLERAQIASLALLAEDMLDEALEKELLESAGVMNVVLQRNERRELMLSSPVPQPIVATYDLRDPPAFGLIRDAVIQLLDPEPRVVRIIGAPVRQAGISIEVTLGTADLRARMIDYGVRILALSAVISAITAALLFLAVRRLLVTPIKRVVSHMQSYAAAPEDNRRIIQPQASVRELREAEEALQSMQLQLTGALRQKERLAQLGSAVAKVSHDLRNILTTAQLFADRVDSSGDPAVRRVVPKLVNSISRAVNLCEGTLAFGKAEEPPPALTMLKLAPIVEDVLESEQLACEGSPVTLRGQIPAGFTLRADSEQLHRILSNLVRNARQAIEATGAPGEIVISSSDQDTDWHITVRDTGPGLPPKAREYLFQPFSGGSRKGGTGLGLAIADDLVRGHGGRLELKHTGPEGTQFTLVLPKTVIDTTDAPTRVRPQIA
ncbi:MAG: signal transduction histidine kinase [Paracoccaceae bacterium]|jgi:signal transduction histidine kinase